MNITIPFEYMHEDVRAFKMAELIDHLNFRGKEGWYLASYGKADKPGYVSVILSRPLAENVVMDSLNVDAGSATGGHAYEDPKYGGWYCSRCGAVIYNASVKDIAEHICEGRRN